MLFLDLNKTSSLPLFCFNYENWINVVPSTYKLKVSEYLKTMICNFKAFKTVKLGIFCAIQLDEIEKHFNKDLTIQMLYLFITGDFRSFMPSVHPLLNYWLS